MADELPLEKIDGCYVGYVDRGTTPPGISYLGATAQTSGVTGAWGATATDPLMLFRDVYALPQDGIFICMGNNASFKDHVLSSKGQDTLPKPAVWLDKSLAQTLFITGHGDSTYIADNRFMSGLLGKDGSHAIWEPNSLTANGLFFTPRWHYDTFPQARRVRLSQARCPVNILSDLVASVPTVTSFIWDFATSPELKGYGRVNIVVRVGEAAFDTLFNAPGGLRGQFFVHPVIDGAGEIMTRCVIKALLPTIQAHMSTIPNLQIAHVTASLNGKTAKVWMNEWEEDANGVQKGLPGAYKDDIPFPIARWSEYLTAADGDSILKFLNLTAADIKKRVKWGCYAPLRQELRIMGEWIDNNGNGKVASSKATRSNQIAYLGFS